MKFCTAINCMDGRVQLPVIQYLQDYFQAQYVDVVSEPGPNRILAEQKDPQLMASIINRLDISVNLHHSKGIALVGHYDCAGNPATKSEQLIHLDDAREILVRNYPEVEIIGLWVDENWSVSQVMGSREALTQ